MVKRRKLVTCLARSGCRPYGRPLTCFGGSFSAARGNWI